MVLGGGAEVLAWAIMILITILTLVGASPGAWPVMLGQGARVYYNPWVI